jgi:hypothetical protein
MQPLHFQVNRLYKSTSDYAPSFFEPFGMYCPLTMLDQISDPPDEKVNSALLLSRRTYPPQAFFESPFLNCVGGNLPKLGR